MPTQRRLVWREVSEHGGAAAAGVAFADDSGQHVQPPTFVVRVRRTFDLLDLELAFIGFRGRAGGLVADHFPSPQNLAKPSLTSKRKPGMSVSPVEAGGRPNATTPVSRYSSGPSRLVFVAPADVRLPLREGERAVDR